MDGFELCRRIRQSAALGRTPVVFLTARADEVDRVLGLEIGGDDYMTKPFSPRELVARVKAHLRREEMDAGAEAQTIGPFRLDPGGRRVFLKDKELALTSTEFNLLEFFPHASGPRLQPRSASGGAMGRTAVCHAEDGGRPRAPFAGADRRAARRTAAPGDGSRFRVPVRGIGLSRRALIPNSFFLNQSVTSALVILVLKTGCRMKKIVVIEDDGDLLSLLKYNLEKEGFSVAGLQTGRGAMELCRQTRPDLVLLDIMLPDSDGLDICKAIRRDPDLAPVPVIFLTARASETDRIVGLELGANDYVVKPFFVRELIARIKLQFRNQTAPPRVLEAGGVALDTTSRQVKLNGEPLQLTATEFRLLEFLMSRPGVVFSREQLLNAVWGQDRAITDRAVDVYVLRLAAEGGAGLRRPGADSFGPRIRLHVRAQKGGGRLDLLWSVASLPRILQ